MHKQLLTAIATAALLAATSAANAQQIYRIVAPDGAVSFSDKPPVSGKAAQVGSISSDAPAAASSAGNMAVLPLAVKEAVKQYPVTLYTSANCNPCKVARDYLKGRGVPFTEKTVTSNDEIRALEKINGSSSLPFATIGGQHLTGFNQNDWASYLDAAGYPAQSQLPPGWRQGAATALIPKVVAPAPAKTTDVDAADAPASSSFTPQRVTPSNPSGIVF